MRQKWNDPQGETLVEVLAAILIGALSIALLFTAVMASGSMDKKARDVDEPFNTALVNAERQGTGDEYSASGAVTVTGNGATATPPVTFYGGEGALSYALTP